MSGYACLGTAVLARKKTGIRPAARTRNTVAASVLRKVHCQLVSRLSSRDLETNWAINVKSASRKIARKPELILDED